MIILGIYDDHNASAALMINGEIVEAINEERITFIKNDVGFPKNAVKYLFKKYNINNDNLDFVGVSSSRPSAEQYNRLSAYIGIKDYKYFYKNYYNKKFNNINIFQKFIDKKNYSFDKSLYYHVNKKYNNKLNYSNIAHQNTVRQVFNDFYKISKNKIQFIDHHTCHLSHAYLSKVKKTKGPTIGVTVDAFGDGRNQTVWKIKNNNYRLLADSNQCEIARIYRMVTLYLGMLPLQHEYKVMGLSPYAKKNYSNEIKDFFNTIIKLDGIKFVHRSRPKNMYTHIQENLQNYRFDNISRGLQDFVEENLVNLFKNIYQSTGIKNFVYSGGVAMNVKANKILHQNNFINDLFVPAAPDDQGTSIGACYEIARLNNIKTTPIKNYYLGYDINDKNSNYLKYRKKNFKFKSEKLNTNKIVNLLIKGEIIARASGRMEFGSRSLGNRSLLASPNKNNVVKKINELIKNRDFWMPFAGTICSELANSYIKNPKKINGSFMTIAFDTKENKCNFAAATHPYDSTIRCQILKKEENHWYYNLLMSFYKKTKIPVLLNTSLNVHGKPIVMDEKKALELFKETPLKYLILGNKLLTKIK